MSPSNDIRKLKPYPNLQIHPNKRITRRIFKIVDRDKSNTMEFDEFMNFLLMMQHGEISDKTYFVFDLISNDYKSFTFGDLVVFYLKIIDDLESCPDPDMLVEEDFNLFLGETVEEREELMEFLDKNLVASISLADVFFGLLGAEPKDKINREFFVAFIKEYPNTIDLLNFISLKQKNFKNVQRFNKQTRFLQSFKGLIDDFAVVIGEGTGSKIPEDDKINILHIDRFLAKAKNIHAQIQDSNSKMSFNNIHESNRRLQIQTLHQGTPISKAAKQSSFNVHAMKKKTFAESQYIFEDDIQGKQYLLYFVLRQCS